MQGLVMTFRSRAGHTRACVRNRDACLKRRPPRVDQLHMRLPAPGRWTLLRKFTVLSLVCFAALGVALTQLLAHQIRHRALSNTVSSAQLLSSTIANGQLRPSDLTGAPMDPARRRGPAARAPPAPPQQP